MSTPEELEWEAAYEQAVESLEEWQARHAYDDRVTRYAHTRDGMRPDPAGPYIEYGDFLDAVAAAGRAAEQAAYRHGYNDRAKAEARTRAEYGGRPSLPKGGE